MSTEPAETPLSLLVESTRAFSDLTRLRVLILLSKSGEMNPRQLIDLTGIHESTMHHHLKELVISGLVDKLKRGHYTLYLINHARVREVLADLSNLLEQKDT